MTIHLTLASYHADLTRPLMSGEVEPDGIELTTLSEYPPKRFRRFFEYGEYDVCEVSLSSYLASLSNPDRYPFTAIPVFPEKKFRHAFLYTLTESTIAGPKDLEGKTVGIESWDTATGVWLRGILREQYGVAIDEIQYYARKDCDVPVDVPERFDVETLGADQVSDLSDHREHFFNGRFDAAIDPSGGMYNPVMESEDAELVFDDVYDEERRYYEATGIHPPMHTVAIRDEILEEHPWVAVNLYDAFCEARDRCLEWNQSPASHASLPWSHLHRHEYRSLLGDDVWEYGLTDKTRRELSTFIKYAQNQGVADRKYEPAELFVDATVSG